MRILIIIASLILTTPAVAGPFGFGTGATSAPWLSAAKRQIGTNPTGWKSRWCAYYLGTLPGVKYRSNLALDWRKAGRPVGYVPGAIAVMHRKGGGHVGIIDHCSGSTCVIISGNGRGGKVDRKAYPKSRIVATRWPG